MNVKKQTTQLKIGYGPEQSSQKKYKWLRNTSGSVHHPYIMEIQIKITLIFTLTESEWLRVRE